MRNMSNFRLPNEIREVPKESKTNMNVYTTEALKGNLEFLAKENGLSFNKFVTSILEDYMAYVKENSRK